MSAPALDDNWAMTEAALAYRCTACNVIIDCMNFRRPRCKCGRNPVEDAAAVRRRTLKALGAAPEAP